MDVSDQNAPAAARAREATGPRPARTSTAGEKGILWAGFCQFCQRAGVWRHDMPAIFGHSGCAPSVPISPGNGRRHAPPRPGEITNQSRRHTHPFFGRPQSRRRSPPDAVRDVWDARW